LLLPLLSLDVLADLLLVCFGLLRRLGLFNGWFALAGLGWLAQTHVVGTLAAHFSLIQPILVVQGSGWRNHVTLTSLSLDLIIDFSLEVVDFIDVALVLHLTWLLAASSA
jgi:hypothetical protein